MISEPFKNKDVFLLGMRWHIRGILTNDDTNYYWLDQASLVYSHDNEKITDSTELGKSVMVNKCNIVAMCRTKNFLPEEKPLLL